MTVTDQQSRAECYEPEDPSAILRMVAAMALAALADDDARRVLDERMPDAARPVESLEVVRARRFELVDDQGRVRAVLGAYGSDKTFGLQLHYADGREAVLLVANEPDVYGSGDPGGADLQMAPHGQGSYDLNISTDADNGPHIVYAPEPEKIACRALTIDRRGVLMDDDWAKS